MGARYTIVPCVPPAAKIVATLAFNFKQACCSAYALWMLPWLKPTPAATPTANAVVGPTPGATVIVLL